MKAAQEMARKRWKGKTDEEKAEHAKMMSDARQEATTPEQRKAAAKKAAKARWAKKLSAAAVILGRLGGQRKVPKGIAMLPEEERKKLAKKAVAARRAKAKKAAGK
jgi:hypothetical protein